MNTCDRCCEQDGADGAADEKASSAASSLCMPIVTPKWTSSFRTTSTAATVEVDIMPHLARVPEGGSFGGYATALHDLGAAYVRFSPWYLYPRVAVAELTKTDCSAHGSTWNSTLLDQVVSDFMTTCLLYTSPSPRDGLLSRMPSSA